MKRSKAMNVGTQSRAPRIKAARPLSVLELGLLAILSTWTCVSYADIYRCDNTPGVITLSNIQKDKTCKKMILPPIEKRAKTDTPTAGNVKPGDPASSKAAKNKSTYENAQGERKRIIEEELDMEQDRLNAINAKIANLNSPSNKSTNKAKELAALQKKQSLHQGNIELLQKELKKQ
jgi:hypothetical protein